MGTTEASRYWVYWVPAQYVDSIKEAIFGGWLCVLVILVDFFSIQHLLLYTFIKNKLCIWMFNLILTAQNFNFYYYSWKNYQIVFIKIILFFNSVNYKYIFPEQTIIISIMYKIKIKFLEIIYCVFTFT